MQIARIENELRIDKLQSCPKFDWLKNSYGAGREFWQSFKDAADEIFPVRTTSTLFKKYNLYYDLIFRNMQNSNPALVFYEAKSGLKSISYKELHERALAKAFFWKSAGVDYKKTVCVVRTMGTELMVELAAALQIGCLPAFLPPLGRSYLQKNLALLAPDYISMDKKIISLISEPLQEKILETNIENNTGNEKGGVEFFNYMTGHPVFAAFDICSENPVINKIKVDDIYLGSLRDGLIALGLGPGRVYAAPGFHSLEIYPGLILAGLLCGATYLHLTEQEIKENPQLAVEMKIHAFGVSKSMRDFLLEKPVNADGVWQTWFRNPAESADMDNWHEFSDRLNLKNSYSFNVRWNTATGGCNLFSVRRKGTPHTGVLPALAGSWRLSDISDTGEESLSDFGILSISPPGASMEDEKKPTGDMISAKDNEWLYLGVNYLNRKGRHYPAPDLLVILKKFIKEIYFSIVEVLQSNSPGSSFIVLLAFYGYEKDFVKQRAADNIRKLIKLEMGEEFQPDKIDFFPLYPRFSPDGEIDHDWCRTAYLTRRLQKGIKDDVILRITKMRKHLSRQSVIKGQ